MRKSRQASASVPPARLLNNLRPHFLGEVWRTITRIAVDNDDLGDEIGREIGKHAANGLRFVMRRNNDRDSHTDSLFTTRRMKGAGVPARRRSPISGPHFR